MKDYSKALLRYVGDKKVFLVTGAPGSGKTHYVKSKIKPDDIALDLDYLTSALALDDNLYGDRKPQLDVALAVRETILTQVENRNGKWNNAYIITTEKNVHKVNTLARRLNAEVIKMQTTETECIDRIRRDTRRKHVSDLHSALVREWFKE